jgi:pimeloyl-ACP methyl ester carboxylesterase
VHIAHQVLGSGPPDLVLVPGFVSHVEAAWDWPYLARFLYRLASFGQLVLFDKRGTGLSDPMKRPPTLDERVDDIRAVMDAVGVERAHMFGVSEGGALSIAFAAHYPHRVESLILYGSYPRKVATADYPWGVSRETVARFSIASMRRGPAEHGGTSSTQTCPLTQTLSAGGRATYAWVPAPAWPVT